MPEQIIQAVRAHERALERQRTDLGFDARMRALIADHRSRSRVRPWMVLAASLLLALGVGWFSPWLARGRAPAQPPAAVSRLAGAPVDGHACRRDFEGDVIELDGRCRVELEGPGVMVETWTRARIEPRPDGLFVHDGLVLIAVNKVRPGGRPVRVGVDGGTIEVLGTQFVVYQGSAGGEVELIEGAIRFARTDGAVVHMGVGDRLRWQPAPRPDVRSADAPELEPASPPSSEGPPSPPTAPTVAPRKPGRRPPPPRVEAPTPELDLDAALAEVAALREARRYEAARERIRSLRRGARLPVGIAELLSFEEGTLLEAEGAAGDACRHWAAHARRFPAGRYASEVFRHRARLRCEGEP